MRQHSEKNFLTFPTISFYPCSLFVHRVMWILVCVSGLLIRVASDGIKYGSHPNTTVTGVGFMSVRMLFYLHGTLNSMTE